MPIYEVSANAFREQIGACNEEDARDIFIRGLGYGYWHEMRKEYARLLALGQVPRGMCQNLDQLIQIREVECDS